MKTFQLLRLLPVLLLVCHAPAALAATDPAPGNPAGDVLGSSAVEGLEGAITDLTQRLRPILAAARGLGADLQQFFGRLADPAQGPSGPRTLQFAISLGASLIAVFLLPAWVERLARRRTKPERQVGAEMVGALFGDLCGIVVLLAIFGVSKTLWFQDGSARAAVEVALLGGFVHWRVLMLVVDVVLRRGRASARLVYAADHHVAEMHRLAAWLLGFVAFSKAMIGAFLHTGMPLATVQLLALLIGIVDGGLALYLIGRLRRVLNKPSGAGTEGARRPSRLARVWYPLTLAFVLAVTAAWVVGAIVMDLDAYWALIAIGGVVLGSLILHSVVKTLLARSVVTGTEAAAAAAAERTARWHALIRHCFGVLLWLAAAVLIIEIGIGPLAHVLPATGWRELRGPVISAAATIYVAYVLWQVVFLHTDKVLTSPGQMLADANGGPPPIASRLQTMLPVLRVFMLITIATVAALIALSDLGVNTTSLIAGASIFGLAISFGSQSLVHDIVSGIFFMADDAFRIGEYIDTGKAKGTVEGMSVRSLRLRHQNGQIHVIPFGQIQQVTNFSRDWTTVKFNLHLQLDTDIEKVRKTVKQIGAEMMEEPELAAELLEPLKLQGVSEIDPQGLVVRLKFTARPGQPTLLQREALKRITTRFREKGIEFANSNMMIQTVAAPATADDLVKPADVGASAVTPAS